MKLNSSKYIYKKLTLDIIEKALLDTFKQVKRAEWVVYTNSIGYIQIELETLRSIYKNIPKVFYTSINKGKYTLMISVKSKHSLVKAYYNARTNSFDMKKGSELLFTFNSFSNTTFDKIKKYL